MSDNTLFVQLQVFDIEPAAGPRAIVSALSRRLREKRIDGVIYGDANDHRGIGLLTWASDPAAILENVHALLGGKRFSALTPRPGWVMFGRVSGESAEGLPDVVLHAEQRWATWYPMRNKAEWGTLDQAKKAAAQKEHGAVAKEFVDSDKVSYVRLSCNGLDPEDNDHIFGLTATSLEDISLLQEAMRGTSQIANYVDKIGPVFVGRKVWQNPEPAKPEAEVTEDDTAPEADAAPEAETADEAAEETPATEEAAEEPSADGDSGEWNTD
jgi:chlorite dismutase